ncbi:unnamed protein product [Adineta steineri]|uniref:Uncharacterized protein n=1 Tax=Adineta steineri TaxID=433720 RepID=A0A814UK44_9BILA|nr:unnamed protein product [Adineta steineri]
MAYITYHIILIIVSIIIIVTSKPCDILENMSCECHSSSNNETEQLSCTYYYTPINHTIQLTNTTLENPRSFDSFHLTFHTREFNISAMFINQLSYLFPRSYSPSTSIGRRKQITIKIILTFQDYHQLYFEDYSFYQLFGDKSDYPTSLSLELTASGHIQFAPMAFTQLTVDQMSLHSSSLEPYSFEEIFNNTKIGSLSLEGCTPRSNNTLRRYFNGKIRSAKFTKMAEIVSSEEFPNYPVNSMIIEAHEPRKINATTFMHYQNLYGVNLIRPKFFFDNRSFDGFQYLPNLETIELDAETIKDYAFQHVARTRFFTLGQNVRYLSEHSFDHLDYLTRFDLSKIILDQLYPSSKCILARYLQKQQKLNPSMIIIPPQAEFCDCVYDFILNLLKKKPEQSYIDLCQNTQQERCQLSECDVVKNFRIPLQINKINQQIIPSIDGSINDIPPPPPGSFYPANDRRINQHSPSYYPRYPPPVYHNPETHDNNNNDASIGSAYAETQVIIIQPIQLLSSSSPRSHFVDTFKTNKSSDPNEISANDDDDQTINARSPIHKSQVITDNKDEQDQLVKRNKRLKWISLSLVGITLISVLVVGTIIWYCTYHMPKKTNKSGFQRVPPNSSSV